MSKPPSHLGKGTKNENAYVEKVKRGVERYERGVTSQINAQNAALSAGYDDDPNLEKNRNKLKCVLALQRLPRIDLHNAEQVQNSINQYFEIYMEAGLKPTVAGLALALHIDRETLRAIARGVATNHQYANMPDDVQRIIAETYRAQEVFWESMMNDFGIHPTAGIYLGQNNFGYKNEVTLVAAPPKEQEVDIDAIRKRYLAQSNPVDADDGKE